MSLYKKNYVLSVNQSAVYPYTVLKYSYLYPQVVVTLFVLLVIYVPVLFFLQKKKNI